MRLRGKSDLWQEVTETPRQHAKRTTAKAIAATTLTGSSDASDRGLDSYAVKAVDTRPRPRSPKPLLDIGLRKCIPS